MGNSQTLTCTSGEKSSKAQQKEERYTKKPVENGTGKDAAANGTGTPEGEVVASSEVPETEVCEDKAGVEQTSKPSSDDPTVNTEEEAEPVAAVVEETNCADQAEAKVENAEESDGKDTEKASDEAELRIEEPDDRPEDNKVSSETEETTATKEESDEVKAADADDSLSHAVMSALSSETNKTGEGEVDSSAVQVVISAEEPVNNLEEKSPVEVEVNDILPVQETTITSSVEINSSVSGDGEGANNVEGGSEALNSSADSNELATDCQPKLNGDVTLSDDETSNTAVVNVTETAIIKAPEAEKVAKEDEEDKNAAEEESKPLVDGSGNCEPEAQS